MYKLHNLVLAENLIIQASNTNDKIWMFAFFLDYLFSISLVVPQLLHHHSVLNAIFWYLPWTVQMQKKKNPDIFAFSLLSYIQIIFSFFRWTYRNIFDTDPCVTNFSFTNILMASLDYVLNIVQGNVMSLNSIKHWFVCDCVFLCVCDALGISMKSEL